MSPFTVAKQNTRARSQPWDHFIVTPNSETVQYLYDATCLIETIPEEIVHVFIFGWEAARRIHSLVFGNTSNICFRFALKTNSESLSLCNLFIIVISYFNHSSLSLLFKSAFSYSVTHTRNWNWSTDLRWCERVRVSHFLLFTMHCSAPILTIGYTTMQPHISLYFTDAMGSFSSFFMIWRISVEYP